MKKIWLIGTGPGGRGALTRDAENVLESAQFFLGAGSVLGRFSPLTEREGCRCTAEYRPRQLVEEIRRAEEERIAVLFSGDSGFFSGCRGVLPLLEDMDVTVLPGISSLSYLAARFGISWEDAVILSLHGRRNSLVPLLRRHRKLFVLAAENMRECFASLVRYGLGDCRVYGGQSLSLPEEELFSGTAEELSHREITPLSVFFILNPSPEPVPQFGIPDGAFLRGSVPMSKSEVRAVTLSRLCLLPEDNVYDIGAGTGSVSVEMALNVPRGHVWAVECVSEGVELIRQNAERFGLANLTVVEGMAPEALEGLPVPDAVFIGGSRGRMEDLLGSLLAKNPRVRIVINAVTLETVHEASKLLTAFGREPEIVQLSVSRARKAGSYHLMTAENPVWIMSSMPAAEEEKA